MTWRIPEDMIYLTWIIRKLDFVQPKGIIDAT